MVFHKNKNNNKINVTVELHLDESYKGALFEHATAESSKLYRGTPTCPVM